MRMLSRSPVFSVRRSSPLPASPGQKCGREEHLALRRTHYVLHGLSPDLYASDTVAFSSVDQGQTGPFPNKVTFNTNQWAAVPLAFSWSFGSDLKDFFHRKADRLFPDVNLIFEPSRFTGQFTPTDNFLTVQQGQGSVGTCNGTTTSGICSFSVDVEQQRTLSWSPRFGIRLENTDSYMEIGGQGSRDWRIPLQYIFNADAAVPIPCALRIHCRRVCCKMLVPLMCRKESSR